jgi:hypothetical protein
MTLATASCDNRPVRSVVDGDLCWDVPGTLADRRRPNLRSIAALSPLLDVPGQWHTIEVYAQPSAAIRRAADLRRLAYYRPSGLWEVRREGTAVRARYLGPAPGGRS